MLTIFDPDALQVVALIVGNQLLDEGLDRFACDDREHLAACCLLWILELTD